MRFLNDMLGNLLPEKEEEQVQGSEVIIREAIVTTKIFENDFDTWLGKGMHKGLLDYLKECMTARQVNSDSGVNLYFHESKNSNGLYFRSEQPWETEDYRFLVHLFAQKLKAMQYVPNNAIREVVEEKGVLKINEEYFFKPSLKFRREIPFEQLFGNVSIEHRIKGEQTELIKIMVSTYTDRHYKKPYDFEDFLTEICLP